jgi:hypothetical protein
VSEHRTARETLIHHLQDRVDGLRDGGFSETFIGPIEAAIAALRAAPAPTGDYSKAEQDCRGCMGPCGRCHESDGAAPAPEGETPCMDRVCKLFKASGVCCPDDECDIETGARSSADYAPASPGPTPEGES